MALPTSSDQKRMPGIAGRLLDAFGQAVIITSPDGIVVAWNPYAETLYGWTAAEAIGRSILQLAPTPEAGDPWSGEFPVQRKDGTCFTAFVTDTSVRDDDGEILPIVGLSHDATERRAREEELRRNEELPRGPGPRELRGGPWRRASSSTSTAR